MPRLVNSSRPAGEYLVAHITHTTPPKGFLYCDGSSLSTTTYAALFSVLGYTFGGSGSNFSLPDMRGYFPRGLDTTSSTRDPDKNSRSGGDVNKLGSYQADALLQHDHRIDVNNNLLYNGSNGRPNDAPNLDDVYNGNGGIDRTSGVISGNVSTETRPLNRAFSYFIRY